MQVACFASARAKVRQRHARVMPTACPKLPLLRPKLRAPVRHLGMAGSKQERARLVLTDLPGILWGQPSIPLQVKFYMLDSRVGGDTA